MTAKRIDTVDRADWLAARRQGLGASDIGAVAGVSPWATAWSVWVDKTQPPADDEGSEAMRWGTLLEPAILDEFAARTSLETVDRGTLWQRVDEPWMLATPDAIAVDADGTPLGVVDAKVDSTTRNDWDEIPAHYDCQLQWQMAVCGLDRAWLVVLHSGVRLQVIETEANPALQDALIGIGREFWHDHVLAGVEPPAVAADTKSLTTLYPGSADEVEVEASPDVEALVAELRQVRGVVKAHAERQDALEARVKQAMGDGTVLVGADGGRLVTWKASVSQRVDTTALRKDHPDLVTAYTKATPSRRFLIKETP